VSAPEVTPSELEQPAAGELASPDHGMLTRRRRTALVAAAFVIAGVVLFFAYLGQAKTLAVASDGSSQALQAWDMLHGNLLLRGWSLTDVTFYTTELPEYMLVELVRGLTSSVVHISTALTYTLLVLLVGVVAKGNATGREGVVRVLIASGILLAPPLGVKSMTAVVLSNPDHTGLQVPLLLIWLLLDRARLRWWVPVAVTAALIWVQIADVMALYEGVVPLVIVCVVRMFKRRGPLAGQWYDLSLAAGAVFSAFAATRILIAIREAGGFDFIPPAATLSTASQLTLHFRAKLESLLVLFGANFSGRSVTSAVVPLLHMAGLALVIVAAGYAVRRFWHEDSLMVQVLTVAFFVVLAAFMLGVRVHAWEAVGLLAIGAVLAGRLLAGPLIGTRLAVPLAVVLACFVILLVHGATAPQPASFSQKLASWLEAHDLHYGLAPYGQASSVTLDSDDRVQVRPISIAGNELHRSSTHSNSDASWYNPRLHDARFIMWPDKSSKSLRSIKGALGDPTRTYEVGGWVIMIWHKNLLDGPFKSGPFVPWDILADGSARPDPSVTRV
jgi:hypothetical protein